MNATRSENPFTTMAIRAGVLVPVLYFGIQLLAALFFPGYDFVRQAASDLGSDGSNLPMLFNIGAMLLGVAALLAALGFWFVLSWLRVQTLLVWVTALALVLVALGNLWAGVFPLPDPRHAANPFSIGLFLMPILLTVLAWNLQEANMLRSYLVVNLLVLIGLVAMRAFNLDIRSVEGLFQRALALVVFMPIGVMAWFLTGRTARA